MRQNRVQCLDFNLKKLIGDALLQAKLLEQEKADNAREQIRKKPALKGVLRPQRFVANAKLYDEVHEIVMGFTTCKGTYETWAKGHYSERK